MGSTGTDRLTAAGQPPVRHRWSSVAPLMALALAVGACSDQAGDRAGDGPEGSPAGGVEVPVGWSVTEAVAGLDRPTQVALAADGRLLVAQLAGAESDGTGQILAVDLDDPDDIEVMAEGLDKPTGVAEVDGMLWVMERRTLSVGPAGGDLEVVADDLPSNGRSETTLTPTPDGAVVYATTGDQEGPGAVDGSGILWRVEAGGEPEIVATGLKNAYGHTFDGDGQLWVTEIGDGRYDGDPPPDELMAVDEGADFAWPVCIGDRTPVIENGGTPERCAASPPSHALFEAGATPTSVAVAPWDAEVLVVALWNRGQVVTVPRQPGDEPHDATRFLGGIDHPQHLLAVGDELLVVDHDGGRILAVSRTG